MRKTWVWLGTLAGLVIGFALPLGACGGQTAIDPASGGSGAATPTGGGGGTQDLSCAELAAEYLVQFEAARICDPQLDVDQCTLTMGHELYCPCPRPINSDNEQAVMMLEQLAAAWAAESCPPTTPTCDAGMCPDPTGSCAEQPPGSAAPGLCSPIY